MDLACMHKVFPHIHDKIFHYLSTEDLLIAGLTCKIWKRFTDEVYDKKGMIIIEATFAREFN